MTTPEAAARYLSEHLERMQGKGFAVHNPDGLSLDELPAIYGFSNGGDPDFIQAIAIAQDGTVLGVHGCSHEGYIPHDLGILADTRPDRHETYRAHYPHGYRMEFVPCKDVREHAGLQEAVTRYREQRASGVAREETP